ncbi:MAG: hypothetical protein KKB50_18110 [Planctomycetes bacterium]|nr:hypothetical protein [Planctomycetota bacterium]
MRNLVQECLLATLLPLVTLPALMLPGCAGADFGSELSAKPKTHALDHSQGTTLRLPQDEPFAIASFEAQQAADLGGTAKGEAHADAAGNADASAEVSAGGQASGSFQLGHAFRNKTERQMELAITVRFNYEYQLADAAPAQAADTSIGLKLYARDGQNRLLRNFDLLQHNAADGAAVRQAGEDFRFAVPVGPGELLHVFLSGRVVIAASHGRSGAGALRVSAFEIEVQTRPAPPVRTAGDERS